MAIAERLELLARKALIGVLVSCKHKTSGAHSATSCRTLSTRSRIELMFQLTTRNITAWPLAGARSIAGPAKAMAPGRGGRPGACMSEAFGGNRARRGNGTVLKRVW